MTGGYHHSVWLQLPPEDEADAAAVAHEWQEDVDCGQTSAEPLMSGRREGQLAVRSG